MTDNQNNSNSGLIKSVQKSLKILKHIIDVQEEVSLADIERSLGYNVSTTHHLLKTLMEEGFISQNKANRKYDIGPEMFFAWLGGRRPEKYFYRVTPIIEECVNITGETTNLFIRDDNEAICITGSESRQTLRAFLMIGRKIPLYCTSAGKAFLMHLKMEQLYDLLNNIKLEKYLPNTISDINLLIKDLEISRMRGYSIEDNEYEEAVTAVGVPVFDHNGRAICTLSSIAPSVRMNQEKIEFIADVLKQSSKKISETLKEIYY